MLRVFKSNFNTVRAGLYGIVLLCTAIALSMAAKFAAVLSIEGLAAFVPFALVICIIGILILVSLLALGWMKERNPINTRKELFILLGVGASFLIFGLVLPFLDAKDADVECFASSSSTTVLDDSVAGFRSEQYHAMYRVMNAFILLAAIFTFFPSAAMYLWALRKARNGDQHMLYAPITQCAWFEKYSKTTTLPSYEKRAARRHRSRSTNHAPQTRYPERAYQTTEKPRRQGSKGSKGSTGSLLDHAQVRKITEGGMQNPYRDWNTRH